MFCFMSSLLLLPAVFRPKDVDSLLQVRMMLIMTSTFYCAVIMFSYFGKVLKVNWWRKHIYAMALPFTIVMVSACVFSVLPGTQLEGVVRKVYFGVTGTLSVVFLMAFIMAIVMIGKALNRFSEENFSNPQDFPRRYAISVIWIPVSHVLVSWTSTLIGTIPSVSVAMIILSVINTLFLLGALSPHRAKDVRQLEEGDVAPDADVIPVPDAVKEQESTGSISREYKDELVRTIRRCVEQDEAYLDSHLTLASLSRSCGVNRSYVSQVMNERLGGFFNYINRCRMDHAAKMREESPDASVEDVAIASGFGSRSLITTCAVSSKPSSRAAGYHYYSSSR